MTDLRKQTMNRLNEADLCSPSVPKPLPVMPLSVFEELMHKVAYENGFLETKEVFIKSFIDALSGGTNISGIIIQKSSVADFPEKGTENAIYIDTENKHIYFWNNEKYYQIFSGSSEEDLIIPSDGLIYEGGEI